MTAGTTEREAGRGSLSRERVLRCAINLADQGGLEALSMRHLARALRDAEDPGCPPTRGSPGHGLREREPDVRQACR